MGDKSVCLNCRMSFSYDMNYDNIISRVCPQCKNKMINVDYKFKAPKKDNIKKWEVIKYLLENGFYFQHIYENNSWENNKIVKYPKNIKDAKIFVEKYSFQKIVGNYGIKENNDGGKYHKHKKVKKQV